MAKKIEVQALNSMVIGAVEETFKQMCRVSFTAEPVAVEKDIIEYDGRMRVFPMEKFNGPAYVSVVNYYISEKHLQVTDALGTFLLCVKEDVVDRLFKAFGRPGSEAEVEANCLDVVGELGKVIAGNLKNEIAAAGFMDLTVSPAQSYKNTVAEGVPFDFSLFRKQQITFSFWKDACVVVEMCIGHVPEKGR